MQWQIAMKALGFYDVLQEHGFADLGVAVTSDEKRDAMLEKLDELFSTDTRDHWVASLRAADIVSAPTNTMLEASTDPDVIANGYVAEMDYPAFGKTLKVYGSPWKFSQTPAEIGIAPTLGEDNEQILADLGYSSEEITELAVKKVI